MSHALVVDLARHMVMTALLIAAPMLIVALAIGLVVSIIQAVTQIQEQTLSFVPKLHRCRRDVHHRSSLDHPGDGALHDRALQIHPGDGFLNVVRPLDLFAPGSAAVAVLLAMRMTGLMLIAPVFSAKTVPVALRTALLVLFTVLIQPVAYASAHGIPQITPASAVGELLVGFAIGLGVALLVGAAETAGDLIAIQIGLSGASLLDPFSNVSSPVLSNFFSLFVITLLLALNVHLAMLEAIGSSLRAVPIGSAMNIQSGLGAMLSLGGTLFVSGLQFAAPVLATVMIGNVALAVLSRAAPQLNILSVAFPTADRPRAVLARDRAAIHRDHDRQLSGTLRQPADHTLHRIHAGWGPLSNG